MCSLMKKPQVARNISGNFYNKHKSRNPLVKYLMRKFYKTLFNYIEEINVIKMLDVGCGKGYILEEIMNINVNIESACNLKRSTDSFELVTMLELLEHLETPEVAIKEAKRVTKNYFIVSVPYEPYWRILNILRLRYLNDLGNTPGHLNHWSKKGLESLLKRYFKNVQVKTVFPWNFAICSD